MGIGGQGQPAWDDDEVLEDIVRYLSNNDDDQWDKWAPVKPHATDGRTNREILKQLCPKGNLIRLYWNQDSHQEVGACEWVGEDLECNGFEAGLAEFEVTCEQPVEHNRMMDKELRKLHPDDFGY